MSSFLRSGMPDKHQKLYLLKADDGRYGQSLLLQTFPMGHGLGNKSRDLPYVMIKNALIYTMRILKHYWSFVQIKYPRMPCR